MLFFFQLLSRFPSTWNILEIKPFLHNAFRSTLQEWSELQLEYGLTKYNAKLSIVDLPNKSHFLLIKDDTLCSVCHQSICLYGPSDSFAWLIPKNQVVHTHCLSSNQWIKSMLMQFLFPLIYFCTSVVCLVFSYLLILFFLLSCWSLKSFKPTNCSALYLLNFLFLCLMYIFTCFLWAITFSCIYIYIILTTWYLKRMSTLVMPVEQFISHLNSVA